jgi:MFS transporter, DHA1 family, multidrug resistance protein
VADAADVAAVAGADAVVRRTVGPVIDDARMLRLAFALFAVQAGFHGFTASLPVALSRAGVADPQIGLIVGVASLVQVPAAFVAGVVVDRVGGLRVLGFGGLAYLVGCAILLLPGVEAGGPAGPFLVARFFQGVGIAGTLPAAMSLVPRLTTPEQRGVSLAFIGSAHNLTLVAMPPLSLAVLSATSLRGVALAMTIVVVAGLVVAFGRPFRFRDRAPQELHLDAQHEVAPRRLGLALRSSWVPLITMILLYIVHWGVIVAYLPQRAEAAGADIGLFFAADGVAVLASRVPSGWLADRIRPLILILIGLAMSGGSVVMLTMPLTTPLLVVAGLLGGVGGGLVMTPILVELSRRSADADRGSAFSLFSASLAMALVIGSIGAAPVIATVGFAGTLLAGLVGIVGAAVVATTDRGLRAQPHRRVVGPSLNRVIE